MRRRRLLAPALLLALAASSAFAQKSCVKVSFDGEVRAGQEFERAFSPSLEFRMHPTAAGWRAEILQPGTQPAHDAAEVATPPYQSASPLLLTTDYSFRAQDAVAWNPRQFQFLVEPSPSSAKDVDTLLDKTSSAAAKQAAEKRLVYGATHAAHGELRILDAALVPGTADQSAAAAAVASHWRTTQHTLVQPAAGHSATPQGSIESLKFHVTLWLPRSVRVVRDIHPVAAACPQ
jgi:hypothetical protein